ncbi:hypothetical protein IEO21_11131 [Rhodonia placenta]|uniref:Uncharacterized protein n=1 Tax=Rhodonia placenta TaxID=104341 RepID=A0A8H7NR41_9APHY|nr:hypothetical protein IEO21_11131 [Postia placenta]
MTARDVRTARDCPLRASLRPWTNAPRAVRTLVPTLPLFHATGQPKTPVLDSTHMYYPA